MPHNLEIGDGVTFSCGNGGIIKIIGDSGSTEFSSRAGTESEFSYYDDLHINAYNDIVLDVAGEYHVEGSVKHLTGDEIMRFNISSIEPNSKADFRLTGLSPNSWYRLRFDGRLATCLGGRAHGRTNERGILTFQEVEIPNE